MQTGMSISAQDTAPALAMASEPIPPTSTGEPPVQLESTGRLQALEDPEPLASDPAPVGSAEVAELAAAIEDLQATVRALRGSLAPPTGQDQSGDTRLAAPDTSAETREALERRIAALEAWLEQDEEDAPQISMEHAVRRLRGAHTGLDQLSAAYDALLDGVRPPNGIPPLNGIRQLYMLLSGDYEMSGRFRGERVSLANVTCATMASLTADALNKRVMNTFQQYPKWWAPIVTVDDFPSLQDVKWITLGGVGELPTVTEGAAYTEMTWDDTYEQDSFVKKGGYLGITIEAIDKDDTSRLRTAPAALAQAAWLTLSKAIAALFSASGTGGLGPDLEDGKALFHADHANYGTTALSWTAWNTTRQLMRDQTELNSGEPLGALTAPRYLLVPNELEVSALQILASEGEPGTADNDINPWSQGASHESFIAAARSRVIVVDFWADPNNWAAVADPRIYPSIGLGFRYGRTPEIYSVASPTLGLMFSNDTLPIKVRFFYVLGAIDHRGMYLHAVS